MAAQQALAEAKPQTMLGNSIKHLLNAWLINDLQTPSEAVQAVRTPQSKDIFGGFVPLHQALMMADQAPDERTQAAFENALQGYAQDMAVRAFALWLEKNGQIDQAAIIYRAMIDEGGMMRRAGRFGLARLGQAIEGETTSFIKLAQRADMPLANDARSGSALVFHNFAWSAYEQAMAEQQAASRAGFDGFRAFLNTPLAYGRIALMLEPQFDEAHYLVGSVYMSNENYVRAAEAFSRVRPQSVYYEYAMIDRARALEKSGDLKRAIQSLEKMVAQDRYALDAMLRLASLYDEADELPAAEQILTKGIEATTILLVRDDTPENESALWRWYFTRGAIRAEHDMWEQAEADFLEANRLAPQQPLVLNYLGYSWVERGKNLDQAFAMIEQALALQPNSSAITDSLGWAYYQRQDFEMAILYLEKAVRLEPSDPVITDHLGDAYSALGRYREARYEWRRALHFDPDEELQKSIKAKLESMAGVMAEEMKY